jgi:glycosyltransferase domain-containing protein
MKNIQPLISVGIPTYNRPDGLKRTLECISAQTYTNLEIIVSDNASANPEVEKLAREFASRDTRISFYRQKENHGAIFNFKFVLEKATGEYFIWVADDDFWRLDSLNIMLAELEKHSEYSVVMSACKRIDDDYKVHDFIHNFKSQLKINLASPFRLTVDASVNHYWTYLFYGLYRSNFLKETFKDTPDIFGADVLFVCQVLMATKILYIDEILYFRQVHKKSTALLYANKKIGRSFTNSMNYYNMAFALGPYLFRSKVIPCYNKLWIPIIAMYLIYHRIISDLKTFSRRIFGHRK